ncbi:MAG: DUF4126 domain-containing protein [Anaerolineales bacterium]|nr:MAG: DUF4126 domain-containing protein [Anaerolineales bacterium]
MVDPLSGVFAAFGLSASAGLNAYIPLLILSLVARFTDLVSLSEPWDALSSWWVIGVLIILTIMEFFADKIPAANHINDAIQTFIRPTAGAIAFAASAKVINDVHPVLAIVAGLLVAGSVHVAKSAVVRPAVTATTGGAGNIPVSIAEDIVATVASLLAVVVPVLIMMILIVVTSYIIWRVWRRVNMESRAP